MRKVFILIAAICFCLDVYAQDYSKTEAKAEGCCPKTDSVSSFRLACDLSLYGYATKDALSLIHAAQIVKNSGLTYQAIDAPTRTSDGGKASGEKSGSKIELDATTLLADATTLANGDKTLLAIIASVETCETRGPVGGEKYSYDRVEAYSTDEYRIKFWAEDKAVVTVRGDGDTDLDLYIYDANGNLICSDTDNTDYCVCSWYPKWTGYFTIRIKNRGSVYNKYYMRAY